MEYILVAKIYSSTLLKKNVKEKYCKNVENH